MVLSNVIVDVTIPRDIKNSEEGTGKKEKRRHLIVAIEMHRCFLLSLQQTLTRMTADVCSGPSSLVAMETVLRFYGLHMSRRDYC